MSSPRHARANLCLAALVATSAGVGLAFGPPADHAPAEPAGTPGALPGPVTRPVADLLQEGAAMDASDALAGADAGPMLETPAPARTAAPSAAPSRPRPRAAAPVVPPAPSRAPAVARPARPVRTPAPARRVVPASVPAPSVASARTYALAAVGSSQFACLDVLWTRESSWNPYASNASTGAYGIPQALPGVKMASAGADWRTNPVTQVRWGLWYIASAYGTPCAALAHEDARHWY